MNQQQKPKSIVIDKSYFTIIIFKYLALDDCPIYKSPNLCLFYRQNGRLCQPSCRPLFSSECKNKRNYRILNKIKNILDMINRLFNRFKELENFGIDNFAYFMAIHIKHISKGVRIDEKADI